MEFVGWDYYSIYNPYIMEIHNPNVWNHHQLQDGHLQRL